MNYFFLALAILAEVMATSALKACQGFTRLWPSLAVVAGYVVAFYALSLTLRTIPVAVAYAIWSGVGVALVTAIGWVVYGEKLDWAGIVGLTLIVAGVFFLQVVSRGTVR